MPSNWRNLNPVIPFGVAALGHLLFVSFSSQSSFIGILITLLHVDSFAGLVRFMESKGRGKESRNVCQISSGIWQQSYLFIYFLQCFNLFFLLYKVVFYVFRKKKMMCAQFSTFHQKESSRALQLRLSLVSPIFIIQTKLYLSLSLLSHTWGK